MDGKGGGSGGGNAAKNELGCGPMCHIMNTSFNFPSLPSKGSRNRFNNLKDNWSDSPIKRNFWILKTLNDYLGVTFKNEML